MIFYHTKLDIIFILIYLVNENDERLLALEDNEGEIYFFDNNKFMSSLEFIGVI